MRKQLYWLRNAVWKPPEALAPPEPPDAHRVEDRWVISGIEPRWRDCPPEYRPYTTIYNRFNRRSRQNLWVRGFRGIER